MNLNMVFKMICMNAVCETTEGIDFDENGICRAATHQTKNAYRWEERAKSLERILEEAKAS